MQRSVVSLSVAILALAAAPAPAGQTGVGPIGFDEAEFPLDEPFFSLQIVSLDGQPIPPLTFSGSGGLQVVSEFISSFEGFAVSSMSDPVAFTNGASGFELDFGGEVSGLSFDAQVFAFDQSSQLPEFLPGTVVITAFDASGSQVATQRTTIPFEILADPLVIGQPVGFSSPTPFRSVEIVVDVAGSTTFNFLLFDNLAYSVSGDVDVELGEEIQVSPTGTSPASAAGPEGRRVVTWLEAGSGSLLAQLLGPDDQPISSVFRVNAGSPAVGLPSVAFDALGNVLFAWQTGSGAGVSGTGRGVGASSIVSRSVSPEGQAQTGEVTVSDETDASAPSIDTSSGGDGIVTWQAGGKARGRNLGRGLAGAGPAFDVSDGSGQSAPRVATAASGDFAVVWVEEVGGTPVVFLRLFSADGTPEGAPIRVSAQDAAAATAPAIASDALGNLVVVWQQAPEEDGEAGFDVLARRYSATGAARGSAQRVHASGAGDQTAPSVAANAAGDFAVAWESSGGSALRSSGAAGRIARSGGGGTSIVSRGFSPSGAGGAEVEVAATDAVGEPAAPQVTIAGDDEINVVFRRRGPGDADAGVFSRRLETALPTTPCVAGAQQLCLADGRFSVRVSWRDFEGNTGTGNATPLTADTGAFWFFDEANVEIVAKVLDARGVNGFFWVFYGALSNVEYTLTVDDSVTGNSKTYFNPLGSFGSVGDTSALPDSAGLAEDAQRLRGVPELAPASGESSLERLATGICANTDDALCLQQSRFEISVTWRDFEGQTGGGTAIPLTTDTGYFWFFDDANVELVIKVLDARGLNGRFWVFYGALSNVEYTITVRDTETGNSKTYTNPLGTFGSVGDTEGLPGS
ncbi:MAG TPA: hypothetical protein VMT85_07675 [Thermoanaerobaculia bacterium]|nr:hypothetical protein [Thermoanaerobaculia bacterium]